MNAYFRMSDAILDCPCALELAEHLTLRDSMVACRQLLFIRLLVYALSPSKQFVDAASLSVYSGVSLKQCERVWEVCLKHGVLRKVDYGYNAREWLVENKFIGRYDKNADSDRAFNAGLYGKGGMR